MSNIRLRASRVTGDGSLAAAFLIYTLKIRNGLNSLKTNDKRISNLYVFPVISARTQSLSLFQSCSWVVSGLGPLSLVPKTGYYIWPVRIAMAPGAPQDHLRRQPHHKPTFPAAVTATSAGPGCPQSGRTCF